MDTSSKVSVEYRDPSGVFPLISRDINAHLPLRNLNWQTQNRPERQIKSLHLDFVPDSSTRNTLQPPAPQNDLERSSSFEILGQGASLGNHNAVKERRHQIPGLQTSPFLKIYFLRCDDKDTYKSTERAKLREWMKQGVASKKKGNHDAFEWLIVHVVIPDTHAASEPRWKEAGSEDVEELKERPKQGAKWPGKSKRTVFDKLRADFNETGKGALDRVAQIRLPKDQVPVDILPTPAIAGTLKETQEEREKAWNDLIGKIRILTLASFDQRVKQYEADIAEQDSRRAMPGFNFCTFFIYKEGLAKALESVGLIEDALVIYDELSLGLESVIRDMANGKAEGTATMFAQYTNDFKERITSDTSPQPNGTPADVVKNSSSIRATEIVESEYRDKIARSTISVFDFFSYLFSRQKTLILRLANAKAARAKLGMSTADGNEDLILISEVCWRAAAFIHNNARILRQDLTTYREDKPWTETSAADVESLVSSWTYEMAGKMLEETASYALDHLPEPGRRESITNAHVSASKSESNLSAPGAYPARTTSLPPRKSRVSELQNRPALQSASDTDLISRPSTDTESGRRSATEEPGFAELVTYRASLVMLRRKSLELLAKQRGWLAGWAMVRETKSSNMEQVDLNGDEEYLTSNGANQTSKKEKASTLLSPSLASALSSEQNYFEAYERLSDQAMRYYVTSTLTKSAEAIVGDMAILKYQKGDFEYAVTYFQHVLPLYADDGWSMMEWEALRLYAACLKEMDRKEAYVQTMLLLLANVCAKKKESKVPRMKFEVADDETTELEHILSRLVDFSATLDVELRTQAERYFSDVQCDREIRHFEDRDGFSLRLQLRHLLEEEIEVEQIRCRLVSVEDQNQEIWLNNADITSLKPGLQQVDLESNAVAFGAYLIDKMIIHAKMLRFEYDFRSESLAEETPVDITLMGARTQSSEAYKQPWIFLYPARNAFNADINLPRNIQLEVTRTFEIKLSSGWNDVHSIDLKLKPASAGLRLHLADVKIPDIDIAKDAEPLSGQIALGGLKANSSALIQIPYSLEQAGREMHIRLEAWYNTSKGSFVFISSSKLPTTLALDVDVRDVFHLDTLFSSFTVSTTDRSPLCITHASLDSSTGYQVTGPPSLPSPMMVFESQPVKLLYKITRELSRSESAEEKSNALSLGMYYYTVNEFLSNTLLKGFIDALEESSFATLSRLLIPLLASRTKALLSNRDFEMALLSNETKTPSFDDIGWKEVILTLPSATRQQLTNWLNSWHNTNPFTALDWNKAKAQCLRSITISVDVPQVDVVHKASLLLPCEDTYSKSNPQILALGEPFNAQLKLTSTRRWSERSQTLAGSTESAADMGRSMNFIFEVHADTDSWLIGGQRRAHFAFQEREELTFDILLMPLKLGIISLPQVDVQVERSNGNADDLSRQTSGPPLTCETHYESAGQVVQVIRDLKTARVHIREWPSAGGHARTQSRPTTATSTKEPG